MSKNQLEASIVCSSPVGLPEHILAKIVVLPAILSFAQIAPFFGISSAGVARRFERGRLGVRVIENGGRFGVLATDLCKFLVDGIKQEQPKLPIRKPRNPFGRYGKSGKRPARRPNKAEQISARTVESAACVFRSNVTSHDKPK